MQSKKKGYFHNKIRSQRDKGSCKKDQRLNFSPNDGEQITMHQIQKKGKVDGRPYKLFQVVN